MLTRTIPSLMALLITCQSCLAGLTFCFDGGDCHTLNTPCHVEQHSHHPGQVHDGCHEPSIFVESDTPHPCDCTDQEIAGDEAVPVKRSHVPSVTPIALTLPTLTSLWHQACTTLRIDRPRGHDDPANDHALYVVGSTRLRL
jgi:hypothetical protein